MTVTDDEENRNEDALVVLRRIRQKLEGRDSLLTGDQRRKLSVPEQSDLLIAQAVSLERVAMMFEGWLPWV